MLDAGYIREKLGCVIEKLDADDDAVRIRLVFAVSELSTLVSGSPWALDPIHDWIRPQAIRLVGELSRVPDFSGNVGALQSTVGSLTDEEARKRSSEILDFARKAHAELK